MPDILSGFNPSGLGQLEGTLNEPTSKVIDFAEVVAWEPDTTPDLANNKDAQSYIRFKSMFDNPLEGATLRPTEPLPFNTNEVKKLQNSGVYDKLGYNRWSNEERRYNPETSNWSDVWNSTVKFLDKTWSSFSSFWEQNADTFKSISDSESSSWMNSNTMDRIAHEQKMEELFPTFTDPQKRHWYSFIPFTTGHGDFLETFVPQLGFTVGTMLGAIAENVVIDALTGGTAAPIEASNSIRKIYTALKEFSTLGTKARLLGNASKNVAIRGLDVGLHGWSMWNTAASEASLEAGMMYNQTKQEILDQYQKIHGHPAYGTDLENIESNVKKAGDDTFGWNMAILLPSNYIMFRNALLPSFARKAALEESVKGYAFKPTVDGFVEVVKESSKGFKDLWKMGNMGKIKALGTIVDLERWKFLTEGFEESSQAYVSNYFGSRSKSSYFNKLNKSHADAIDYVFSSDGLQEFIGGAMGGFIFNKSGHILRRFSTKEVEKKDENGELTGVDFKDNFLARIVGSSDRAKDRQRNIRANIIMDSLNKQNALDLFKEEGIINMLANSNTGGKMEAYYKNNDIFSMENLHSNQLNKFLYSGLVLGKLDLRINQLKKIAELSDEDIAKELSLPNPVEGLQQSIKEFANHLESRVPAFKQIYEEEKHRYTEQINNLTLKSLQSDKEHRDYVNEIVKKYNLESPEDIPGIYEETIDKIIALKEKYDNLSKSSSTDEDLQKVTDITIERAKLEEDEKYKEFNKLNELKDKSFKDSLFLLGVTEARKAATFAAHNMLLDKDRMSDTFRELKKGPFITAGISDLVTLKGVQEKLKVLRAEDEGNIPAIKVTLPDERALAVKKQIKSLEKLEKQYQNRDSINYSTAAKNILEYLKNSYSAEEFNSEEDKQEYLNKLSNVVKLEDRNIANLELYNLLTDSDKMMNDESYAHYFSTKAFKFINDIGEHILNDFEKPQEEELEEPLEKPLTSNAEVNDILSKYSNGEELNEGEINTLKLATTLSDSQGNLLYPLAVNALNDILKPKVETPLEGEVKPPVITPEEQEVLSQVIVPGNFDEQVETRDNLSVVTVGRDADLVTSMQELPGEQRGEDSGVEIPEIENNYSTFRQGFIDRLKMFPQLQRGVTFHVQLLTKELYPSESEGKFTNAQLQIDKTENNKYAGIVIKDNQGRDLFFDNEYRSSLDPKDGVRIIIPFAIRNIQGEGQMSILLADALKYSGLTSFPIELSAINQGFMPKSKNFTRLSDIEKKIGFLTYRPYIAGVEQREKGVTYVKNLRTGEKERNGSMNLVIDGQYLMKLWPVKAINLNIGEAKNADVIGLLNKTFKDFDQTKRAALFLTKLFFSEYTGGVQFIPQSNNTIRVLQNNLDGTFNYDKPSIVENLKGQRINFLNTTWDNVLNAFYVDTEGNIVEVETTYGEFYVNNSATNKKVVKDRNGELVLKTANKFLVFKGSFNDLRAAMYEHIKQKVLAGIEQAEPEEGTIVVKVGQKVKVLTEKDGEGIIKELRGDKVLLEDGRQVSVRNLQILEDTIITEEPIGRVDTSDASEFDEEEGEKGNLGGFKPLVRSTSLTIDDIKEISQEEKDFLENLPGATVRIANIINSDAYATWEGGLITLFKNAVEGTGYHEAWHHFSQMLLSKEQKEELYNEVRKAVPSLEGKSNLEVEEFTAEDFRNYMKGTSILAPKKSLKDKIYEILRRIINFLMGKSNKGITRIQKYYRDLRKGTLNKYTPSKSNIMFGRLNSSVIRDKQGEILFNLQKTSRLLNQFYSSAGKVLAASGKTFSVLKTSSSAARNVVFNNLKIALKSEFKQIGRDVVKSIKDFESLNPGLVSSQSETFLDLKKLLQGDNFDIVFNEFLKDLGASTKDIDTDRVPEETITDETEVVGEDEEKEQTGDEELSSDTFTDSSRDTGFENPGNNVSLIKNASQETKFLIRGLSKVEVDPTTNRAIKDPSGKVVLWKNKHGLNEPVDFSKLFNNLGIILQSSKSVTEMYNKLKDPTTLSILPEIELLLERLGDVPVNPTSLGEVTSITQFFKDFNKFAIDINTLLMFRENGKLDARPKKETRRSADNIIRKWANNFLESLDKDDFLGIDRNKIILDEDSNKPMLNPAITYDFIFTIPEDRERFLKILGITFSPQTRISKEYQEFDFINVLGNLQTSINLRLEVGEKIFAPVRNLSKARKNEKGRFIKGSDEKGNIDKLAALEANYSTDTPSMSYRAPTGNMMYGLMLPNWLNIQSTYLNQFENYHDLQRSGPMFAHWNFMNNVDVEHSLFLNSMFMMDKNIDIRRTFKDRTGINNILLEVGNYTGIREENKDKNEVPKGKMTTSLTRREKLLMDIHSLLGSGKVEIPRTESSSSAFFAKLNRYAVINENPDTGVINYVIPDGNRSVPFPIDKGEKGFLSYIRLQLKSEMNFIQNIYNSNLPGYEKYQKWGLFSDIFDKELGDKLFSKLLLGNQSTDEKKANTEAIIKEYKAEINEAIDNYIIQQIDAQRREFNELGITKDDLADNIFPIDENKNVDKNMERLIRNYFINDWVMNIEYIKLFEGPIQFHKAYHKRAKASISTGYMPVTDDFLENFIKSSYSRTLSYSLGLPVSSVDIKTAVTANFSDYEKDSQFYDILFRDYKAADTSGKSNDDITKLFKAYKGMNIADGQGYCTLDFYRKFRMQVSNWSEDDEIAYMIEVINYRRDNNLYDKLGEQQKITDDEFYKLVWDDITPENRVNTYWVPIKMGHNGFIAGDITGVAAPVMDKFSIAPLIPSVIKGKAHEVLNNKLLEEGIEYAKYESGTKKYKYTLNTLYDKSGNFVLSKDKKSQPFSKYKLWSINLKEQLLTQNKVKDEAIWGTQMRKLFISNMYDLGIANNEKFKNILDDYINLLDTITQSAEKKLFKSLGLKKTEDRIEISNVDHLLQELRKQAEVRDLPINIIDAIKYDPLTKKPYYLLETLPNRGDIQNMISGLLFKKLINLKINGDMLIQISGAGYEDQGFRYTKANEAQVKEFGTGGLSYYHLEYDRDGKPVRTRAMEIKVALTKDFKNILSLKHPDGQSIGNIDRLNELLKDREWSDAHKEVLTIIGYRIPTQGPNSMEVMRVKEFLPERAGSVIILPYEIVAKSGSDFDIDKMTIIRPSIGSSGELLSQDSKEKLESRLDELRSRIDSLKDFSLDKRSDESIQDFLDRKRIEKEDFVRTFTAEEERLLDDYDKISDNNTKVLYNKVIAIYEQALTSPEMFTQLITPNNTNDILDIAAEVARIFNPELKIVKKGEEFNDIAGTGITLPRIQNEKFYQFLAGKRALGIFALNNTLSQILQQSGMMINELYGEGMSVTAEKGIIQNLEDSKREDAILKMVANRRDLNSMNINSEDVSRFEELKSISLDDYFRQKFLIDSDYSSRDLVIDILETIC